MLEINIKKSLRNFQLNVELSLDTPEIVTLVGPSGSGKTSLLRGIAGFEPVEGRIRVGDALWQDDAQGIRLPPHKRRVGYVFQEPFLYPHLSVRENLVVGFRRVPASQRRFAVDEVVELLGLEALLEGEPEELSGGERQRICLGRSLLFSPDLWLLDEPLNALDFRAKKRLLPLLKKVLTSDQKSVIYVSHLPEEVVGLAHRVMEINNGHVSFFGSLSEAKNSCGLVPMLIDGFGEMS